MTINIEPGLVDQAAHLVDTWEFATIDEIAGALTTEEADALARVFAGVRGVRAGLFVMIAHLQKSIEGAQIEADHAEDAAAVARHGWLDDEREWDQVAAVWAVPLFWAEARRLADLNDKLISPDSAE